MRVFTALTFTLAAAVALFLPPSMALGGGRDDPVMAGYDLVSYWSLDPDEDGVPGTSDYQVRHTDGYLYYFSSPENLQEFKSNPSKYLPKYGGFCAWGMAWEYEEDGWPWAANHMGPPCGPRDGWAILTDSTTGEKHLYCSIWRSYQDDFNNKQEEGIRLADERWRSFYGQSAAAPPMNNGCYAWNWQECFAQSIYDPNNQDTGPTVALTTAPTQVPLFQEGDEVFLAAKWSNKTVVMDGAVVFQYTLENVTSVRPLLIVDLLYQLDDEFGSLQEQYLGFGVAEQVMQGALVVCSAMTEGSNEGLSVNVQVSNKAGSMAPLPTYCKTYTGAGMGITEPEFDPVQPKVLMSSYNASHYHLRFSANLFACWSNPVWPARVLFSRGLVSGTGDPMPHQNNDMHRQAVTGVEFLSVVEYTNADASSNGALTTTTPDDGPPDPLELEPLPSGSMMEVEETVGSLEILEGRVTVAYGLYEYGEEKEQVVHIQLQNVPFDPEDEDQANSYIGFGFAENTMSGLVMTCAPLVEGDTTVATCHQWRGQGTNLIPRSLTTDAGGWFLESLQSNGTHLNFTYVGRVQDVVGSNDGKSLTATTNLRAICAIGRAAPGSGNPLVCAVCCDQFV